MSEKKPTIPENVKIKESPWWKMLCGVLTIILAIGSMYGYSYHYTKSKNLEKIISDHNTEIVGMKSMITGKREKVDRLNKELDNLKKKIAGIKDKSDLLKRDIEMYIDTTHPKVSRVVAKAISQNVVDLSRKYKVSPELIIGIIKVESAFNPMAVGPKTKYGHARGLMQVMPEWAKKLGVEGQYEFHNIDVAIESGIKVFLIHLEEGKGDISTGLYYYVNKDKSYVGKVYAAMGKFVAFRSTIDEDTQNVETDININGNSKEVPAEKKGENKVKNDKQ